MPKLNPEKSVNCSTGSKRVRKSERKRDLACTHPSPAKLARPGPKPATEIPSHHGSRTSLMVLGERVLASQPAS
ncbi:hypothetical protein JZ751_001523 [Albula glossodonta]|uniref:Uncharacterized protein n=1 Tax=Albula glossodonta TaxID=121402 RepID=A0A8T2PTX0_9TELE|nr:hypothetical protein JZ751_001523 [Albula glossodonta]